MTNGKNSVRVRFAPSPTGWMHLGNVRAALINALFARQQNGTMILRIEDTDAERMIDPGGKRIQSDLAWLKLTIDEGPFFQSERMALYQEQFNHLLEKKLVYRCFETVEELEAVRQAQMAQGLPPRYNRASLALSEQEINEHLAKNTPFIWRFKLPEHSVAIHDMARGIITYDMQHFSDFALTRQDGSFTFIFANFVDDMLMNITHVIRGEDHITNSANQAALYQAFNKTMPLFLHLPIICNTDGKKLSKRDFGFSLEDLKKSGFLPEAICNYLGIIGGSFKQEIMNFDELAHTVRFDTSSPTGTIHYDVEKLRWVNHKWISRLSIQEVTDRCLPFLQEQFPTVADLPRVTLESFIALIHNDMVTLHDVVEMLGFYFNAPTVTTELLAAHNADAYKQFFATILQHVSASSTPVELLDSIKNLGKEQQRPTKELFTLLRIALTGQPQGLGIKDLFMILGIAESVKRLTRLA